MEPTPPAPPYAVSVLVLTGGASRRMGRHKPSLEVDGRSMVARVVAAARPRPVHVIGRPDDVPDGIPVLVEEPPGGGPVAAVARGLREVPEETDTVVVLAADLPFVTSAHLDRLVQAAMAGPTGSAQPPGAPEGAVTVDATGRRNWLCSAWPRSALAAALAAGLRPVEVADVDRVAVDVDTPKDLEQARRRLEIIRDDEGLPT
jgi:molybdopterin-guanine dinucleotide biosynthesis protein A